MSDQPVKETRSKATPEGLADFIRNTVEPLFAGVRSDLQQFAGRLGGIESSVKRLSLVEQNQAGESALQQEIEHLGEQLSQLAGRLEKLEQPGVEQSGTATAEAVGDAAGTGTDRDLVDPLEAWVRRIEQGIPSEHDLEILQRVIDEVDRREALLIQQNSPPQRPEVPAALEEPYLLVSRQPFPGAVQDPSMGNCWVKVMSHVN